MVHHLDSTGDSSIQRPPTAGHGADHLQNIHNELHQLTSAPSTHAAGKSIDGAGSANDSPAQKHLPGLELFDGAGGARATDSATPSAPGDSRTASAPPAPQASDAGPARASESSAKDSSSTDRINASSSSSEYFLRFPFANAQGSN